MVSDNVRAAATCAYGAGAALAANFVHGAG
jgi:hypothetical protein